MRIIIAGPLPDKYKSGGVAVFNKNIAMQLATNKNNKILIATKAPSLVNKKNNYPANISFTKISNLMELKNFKADIIISCLWYSLYFCYGFNKIIKIHTIHAFPDLVSYKIWKFNVMHLIDRLLRKRFDYLVANSRFTKYLYESLFNIKIDSLFNIGLEPNTLSFLRKKDKGEVKRNRKILYVGRIVKAKHLDKALDAVSKLSLDEYNEFNIWGYGIEEDKLKKKYSNNPQILFHGAMNHFDVYKAYQDSKVFISLNPAEPFGITYEEAMANGLYVIAPDTGGQVEFLSKFPGRYSLVNIQDESSISTALREGLDSSLEPLTEDELNRMSYKRTVRDIFSVIK